MPYTMEPSIADAAGLSKLPAKNIPGTSLSPSRILAQVNPISTNTSPVELLLLNQPLAGTIDNRCLIGKAYKGTQGRSSATIFRQNKIKGSRPIKFLYLQLQGGGQIPPFGVQTSDLDPNKRYLSFGLDDKTEEENLSSLKAFFVDNVVQMAENGSDFWTGSTDRGVIESKMHTFLRESKNGQYSSMMKALIPFDNNNQLECTLEDSDNTPLTLEQLPGRLWRRIIIQLRVMYRTGRGEWGISKRIVRLELSKDNISPDNPDPRTIQFYSDDQPPSVSCSKKRKLTD